MGLLEAKDWSAQWLGVESITDAADREAGLHWIWGEENLEKGIQGFRFRFHLPLGASAGELFAVVNDWPIWTQITRVWLDGLLLGGHSRWSDDLDEVGATESDQVRVALPSMARGEHLIAVEVAASALAPNMADSDFRHALALFARVNLVDGQTLRLVTDSHWKTKRSPQGAWSSAGYDDTAWEVARSILLPQQPWPAKPAMHLRKVFSLAHPALQARLYVTALGAYEARVNGQRVGDAQLTPEITEFAKRVLYQTYDLGALIRTGENVLGLTVGDGWYASFDDRYAWAPPPRRVLAQLELTLADGSRRVVVTEPGWRMAESPIRESQIRIGEVYDARLERAGWDTAQFNDSNWPTAHIAQTPSCRLVAQNSPPIRVTQTLKTQTISEPRPGVYVFDFGQNFAGWCRLHVTGRAGSRIELKFAELLTTSGEVDQSYMSMGKRKRDVYILRGAPNGETFEPHFTYRGFRYVQIEGLPQAPTINSLKGLVVHSDLPVTGQIRSDSALLESVWRNTVRTQRSNFVGIPTDCPSREQRGFMGDAGVFWDAAAFNMDVCAFTARHMADVVDEQTDDGAFPQVAPGPRANNASDHLPGTPPGWGDAGVILPWTVWRRYGDLAIVEKNWEAMNRYVQFILDNNPDYLWKNKRAQDYGDWLAVDQLQPASALPSTPHELIGTAYWARSAKLLAEMGEALSRSEDVARLRALFERIREAFNTAYFRDDGTIGNGSQCGYVLALQFGLVPDASRQDAAEHLAADIRSRGSLTTGFLGTQFILDVLTDAGFTELACGLLLRTEYPSWGYMVGRGATTIWESWGGEQQYEGKHIQLSRNHFALGAVNGYLFRRLAGIDEAAPGFEQIVIRPVLDPRIKRGGGTYDSIMGRIATDWTRDSRGSFSLKVQIPANTSAHVHLPAAAGAHIKESRRDIRARRDLRLIQRSSGEAVIRVGSGSYAFFVDGNG
jgi:alpha-L-rhamnosidase